MANCNIEHGEFGRSSSVSSIHEKSAKNLRLRYYKSLNIIQNASGNYWHETSKLPKVVTEEKTLNNNDQETSNDGTLSNNNNKQPKSMTNAKMYFSFLSSPYYNVVTADDYHQDGDANINHKTNNNSAMKKRAMGAVLTTTVTTTKASAMKPKSMTKTKKPIVVIWARNKHLSFVVPPVLATYNNNTNGTAHLGIHASSKPLPLIDIKSKPKSNQKLRSLFLQQIRVANASRQKPLLSGVVVITTIIDGEEVNTTKVKSILAESITNTDINTNAANPKSSFSYSSSSFHKNMTMDMDRVFVDMDVDNEYVDIDGGDLNVHIASSL
ncbi:hypothetical protein RFI_35666 [Reticulomyxa filosa]|uniref:Uncharacterized protein n=1 Tax=Reticulomyxa filosa TaxID=46433 RepID=X6LII8_RETFI|nr:hypothetical protein RFI_35666 [Reticulomyxa filosa]|eukprot:ETO01773.1 hypothetical protein RFI_35666 [Reticulomyxa filosa]